MAGRPIPATLLTTLELPATYFWGGEMRVLVAAGVAVSISGCAKTPKANPEFSDAVAYLLRTFDGDEVDIAFAMRDLEKQVYKGMDVSANAVNDRALLPETLSRKDVASIERPDRVLANALPVAVAALSPFEPTEHAAIHMLVDHTPVEPYSPEFYEREFLEGRDCWRDRSCDLMRTRNELTKENALMVVDLWFYKDYRWIDLNLPDPAEVPAGEEAQNHGDERWAFVARSWTTEVFTGRKENAWIQQSYSIDVWIPRDGQGYRTNGKDDFTSDSVGGGSLRMLCLWSESRIDGLNISDDTVIATTRVGIDKNFQAADDWLEAH